MKSRTVSYFLLLLTSFAALHAENSDSASIILKELNGKVKVEIVVDGYAPDGIKFVWSLNPDPVYPAREGDRAEFRTLEDSQEFEPEAFAGPGTYYFRAGWYEGGRVKFYSPTVELNLGGSGEVVQGTGRSIRVEVDGRFARAGLTITPDSQPDGVKIVWSKNPKPEYPVRNGDRYIYRELDDSLEVRLDAFDGPGKYYVRAGWYNDGRVLFYSTQVETLLR